MRLACVEIPAFPLQLLWRAEPALRGLPVAIVDHDRPHGTVLWSSKHAREAGVQVGDRYAFALAQCRDLRARRMPEATIAAANEQLRAVLHRLSPRVEPGDPGTFWLDGDGLERVFPDATQGTAGRAWADTIEHELRQLGYRPTIVLGTSRFATYAIARGTRTGVRLTRDPADERALAEHVPLADIRLSPKLCDALGRLDVWRIGGLIRLPYDGLLERFGPDAARLHALASGERWDPLQPVAPPEAPDERVLFDDEERDLERLVFAAKPPIERLLQRLARRGRSLITLHVELTLKHGVGKVSLRRDALKPAVPTLESRTLLRLLHLRLTGRPPVAPINAVRVWADDQVATREQLALFVHAPRRDLRAANEVIASLRAELGDDAVLHAVPREGHLPEARYSWEPIDHVVAAAPPTQRARQLVRRIFDKPRQLPVQGRGLRDDGWLLSGLAHGAVVRIRGPYVVSGAWWMREISRDYHFADLKRGERLWVYYDRHRRRWFWQGAIE